MKKNLYAWIVVALLWVTVVLNYVDRQALFSVFPLIRGDLGLSNLQLGLLSSAFLWAYGLFSPTGRNCRRRGTCVLRTLPQLPVARCIHGIRSAANGQQLVPY